MSKDSAKLGYADSELCRDMYSHWNGRVIQIADSKGRIWQGLGRRGMVENNGSRLIFKQDFYSGVEWRVPDGVHK